MGNPYDQFDQGGNPYDQFDTTSAPPPDPTHYQDLQGAQGQPQPAENNWMQHGVDAVSSIDQVLSAASQRTNPVVRNIHGELNYKPLGPVYQDDSGALHYADASGKTIPIDPQKAVVLIDPKTHQLTAFQRNDRMNEGLLSSLGHVLTIPFMAPATAPAPTGALAAAANPTEMGNATAADFKNSGITPSLATVSHNPGVERATNMLRQSPVGGPLQNRIDTTMAQSGAQADKIAGGYSNATTPVQAGATLQKGAQNFNHILPEVSPADAFKMPSRMTSFATKENALWQKVDKFIPDPSAPIDLTKTTEAFTKGGTGSFDNAALQKILGNPRLKAIADTLKASGGKLSYEDARILKTTVGGMLKDPQVRGDISQGTLKQIYGALSTDIQDGVTQLGGPAATKAFQDANKFTTAGLKRWSDAMQNIIGANSPEQAYSKLLTAAGTGRNANIKMLNQVKRSLTPAEWDDVSATVIANMGKPTAANVGLTEANQFSPAMFIKNYQTLSPEARDVLFNSTGRQELSKSLDTLAKVQNHMRNLQKMGNPSASGVYNMWYGLWGGAGMALLTGNYKTAASIAGLGGSGYLTASMLSSPMVINSISRFGAGLAKAAQSGGGIEKAAPAIARFTADLHQISLAHPEYADQTKAMMDAVNNPNQIPQQETASRHLPSIGVLPGKLELNPSLAPKVSPGSPRPFAPGEALQNPDGSWSSEISLTVTNPVLNDGKPTNIPSLWLVNGKPVRVNEDMAAEFAAKSGLKWRSYKTIQEADDAAALRERVWQSLSTKEAAKIPPLWEKQKK